MALDNPSRALLFVDELEKAAERLAEHPEKAPLAPEAGVGVRRLSHSGYNIYYRYSDGVVRILRVFEGHRDVSRQTLDD